MASRPRRSAAAKAKEVIAAHATWADSDEPSNQTAMSSRRSGRTSGAAVSRDAPSSPDDDSHLSVTVKVSSNKLRQATRGIGRRSDPFEGGEIVHGKRNRGTKKSYVIDSSPDDDDEEEEDEAEIDEDEDEDMEEAGDEDAEGEDVDAEGEEDAEGDIDMDAPQNLPGPTIKVSRHAGGRILNGRPSGNTATPSKSARVAEDDDDEEEDDDDDDDDDDELSDPADSDIGDETMGYGDETMADEDAEGEEIEVAGDDGAEDDEDEDEEDEDMPVARRSAAAGDGEEGLDSDDSNQEGSPDLAKMTKRQRARFEDAPQEHMKLSDEIQVKKVFTAEELSMRRQEMARRRRNLSDKRNEEVKMETINKLLKKQAPKVSRKAAGAGDGLNDPNKPSPVFVRWVSNKNGSHISIPNEIIEGPAGKVFGPKTGLPSGKMVEEVA